MPATSSAASAPTGRCLHPGGDTDSRNGAVNGGKSDQANVTLDGVDVNDQMDRNAFKSVLRMTPDSVQEFRVTTSNATAEQGRSSGAQIALVTKGGTNEVHGSVYAYHRNTVTTANDFFLNSSGVARQKLIRNIYGVSLGGPIVKNRFFLFGNWEGRKDAKDGQALRTIPSMNMRQGILQYRTTSGSLATVTPTQIAQLLDPRGVNQVALADMQKYPAPNDFSSATASTSRVTASPRLLRCAGTPTSPAPTTCSTLRTSTPCLSAATSRTTTNRACRSCPGSPPTA